MANYSNYDNDIPVISEHKTHRLLFSTPVRSPVFTRKHIRGEASSGSESINVILVDNKTNEIVDVEPFGSVRVRIVLLPGDFEGVWTSLQFENNIITNWKNKKNVLQGDHFFNLEHGRGTIGKIWIKHDRNHLSKSKFRLGAMIDGGSFPIKEAITDPFEAKDRRIELNSKNRPVTLEDKVSRLKNVGRKGSKLFKRLENEKIMTVKDFRDRLFSNPVALQKIYGSNGKRWEDTIRHAKSAISSKKCNTRGSSVGSNTKEQEDVSLVDHNSCNRLDVESFEASACASSDDTIPMVFDQFSLDQNFEYYLDEVFYSDLFTTLEQL